MKTCLAKLTLIAAGAALASQAVAQSSARPDDDSATAAPKAAASEPKPPASTATTTVAVNSRIPVPAPVARTVNAAGSVLVLVDGVVVRAAIAQIQPPAPGFVYER